MPNIKSAKKRAKQALVRRDRNRSRKSALRTEIKKFHIALEANNLEDARTLLSSITAMTARAKGKNIMHRNTAARTISRLAKKVNKAAAA